MKIKSITTLFKKYYKLEEITLEHEGKTFTRERINKSDAVTAVVYNTITNKYLFVEQWRPANLDSLVELVAGTLEKTEVPEECMIREVEEEVGYKVDFIQKMINTFYMSPGCSNEQMTIFYCEVSEKINDGGGLKDENENITIIELSEFEVMNKMEDGYFKDAKTLLGLISNGF